MALRFMDGFDHYTTADVLKKWTSSANGPTIQAGQGRRGTAGLRASSGSRYVRKFLDSQDTWIVGFAMRCTFLPATAVSCVELLDTSTSQLDVRVTPSGTLQVTRNGTVLGTTTATISATVYNYIELRAVIHNTTGQAHVQLNGVPVLSLTAQDTQNTANATANTIQVGQGSSGDMGNTDFDDVYVCDGNGAAPHNTYLGDCRVDVLLPSGDGSHSAWTPSTGTTHSTLVDEATPNDDTDYVSTLTAAARETHLFPDLPAMTNPVILAVQHCINARKDDVGTRQLKSVIKSGATTQVGPTTQTIASTYAYYLEVWSTDPATGLAWTVPGVNALEAGFDNLA